MTTLEHTPAVAPRFRGGPTPFRLAALTVGGLLAALVAVPLLLLAVEELRLAPFGEIFEGGRAVRVLRNTAIAVGIATIAATVLGSLFAWLVERTDATLGRLGASLPVLPMLMPPLAGAIGWVLLATPGPGSANIALRSVAGALGMDVGDEGPLDIYTWYGLVFVYTLYLIPHVFLTVAAALRNLDPALEEASRVAGASTWRTLRQVTVPAVAPSIAGGALLALIFGVALFSVPVLIGTGAGIDVLAVVIVRLMSFQFPPETGQAFAYGMVMVLIIGLALLAQARLLRAGRATIGGKANRPSVVGLGVWRHVARAVMIGYILCASVLPFLALLVVSFQPFWSGTWNVENWSLDAYRDVLSTGNTAEALRNSLLLATVGATLAMAVAALIAFVSRRLDPRAAVALRTVTKLPGAFSHVVLGVAFVVTFVGSPFQLQGTLVLLALGYLVVYAPQAAVSAESAMGQIGDELTEASSVSGASEFRTFGRIGLPLMLPGLIAGWVFVFVLITGDVTMSVLLSSNRTPVVGFVMVDLFGNGTYPLLASMGVLITLISTAVVLGVLGFGGSRRRWAR